MKHAKFEVDEVVPRIENDFAEGMASLDELEAALRAALADLDALANH